MLSQSIVIQFLTAAVLGVVNIDVIIASNKYTVKINADDRQQFSKVIKKCSVFGKTFVCTG